MPSEINENDNIEQVTVIKISSRVTYLSPDYLPWLILVLLINIMLQVDGNILKRWYLLSHLYVISYLKDNNP